MSDCFFCNLVKKEQNESLIMENVHACAFAGGYFREGQCTVILKRHVESVSGVRSEEYTSLFDLITKVSAALEKRYDCEKTYLLSIGDQIGHLHFHLIPKHKDKCSMGKYCFAGLFKEEGRLEPSTIDQKKLAESLKALL